MRKTWVAKQSDYNRFHQGLGRNDGAPTARRIRRVYGAQPTAEQQEALRVAQLRHDLEQGKR